MFHNAIQSTKFIQSSQHFQSQKLYLLSPITVNTEFFINSRHFVLVSRQVTGKGNGVKRLFEGGQQLSCTRVLLDVHNPPQKEEDLQILSVTMIIHSDLYATQYFISSFIVTPCLGGFVLKEVVALATSMPLVLEFVYHFTNVYTY